jgi:hypothetical protein
MAANEIGCSVLLQSLQKTGKDLNKLGLHAGL